MRTDSVVGEHSDGTGWAYALVQKSPTSPRMKQLNERAKYGTPAGPQGK
jgi:hypothetical protein